MAWNLTTDETRSDITHYKIIRHVFNHGVNDDNSDATVEVTVGRGYWTGASPAIFTLVGSTTYSYSATEYQAAYNAAAAQAGDKAGALMKTYWYDKLEADGRVGSGGALE